MAKPHLEPGRLLECAALAGLVFCLTAAEQLGGAASTRDALRDAASSRDVAPSWPEWFWPTAAVVGCGLAVVVLVRLRKTVDELRKKRIAREKDAGRTVENPHEADANGLLAFSLIAIGAWVFWQAAFAYPLYRGWPTVPFAEASHWIAIGAAVLALSCAGRAIGDAQLGWERASVVRIQLILLGTLIAGFFLVPITAAQVTDVLRAWGDGPLSRVAYGLAAAVLLGAVVRASAQRLLVPTDWSQKRRDRTSIAAASIGIVAAVMLVVEKVPLGATLGAAALALVLVAAAVLTKWGTPEGVSPDSDTKSRLNRLAGTLGVVPVGILFAGLASALTDSLLLASAAIGENMWLIAATVAVGVVFMGLVAVAHPPEAPTGAGETPGATTSEMKVEHTEPAPSEAAQVQAAPGHEAAAEGNRPDAKPKRNARALERVGQWVESNHAWLGPTALVAVTVMGCLVTMASAAGGTEGDIASVVLAVGVCLLASWRVGERGAPQFCGAAGVVAGTGIAVYADPIDAPRALGAVGVGLVGATGMLLALHLAGTLGARRVPRDQLRQPWLPKHFPVVGVLAIWITAAWLNVPDTLHQARTVSAHRPPSTLTQEVHAWLERQMHLPDGEDPPTRLPMLVVAASGGGSKAAYWTDLVLDCLASDQPPSRGTDECPPPQADGEKRLSRLFLTSSVSGGSVGIYHFLRHRTEAESGKPWVRGSAGVEVLSPIVAWGLFHDLPAFMVGAKLNPARCREANGDGENPNAECLKNADRSVAQEAAVAGFKDGLVPTDSSRVLGARGSDRPVTVFNAALDGADGRVLISPVSLSPPRVTGCETPWTGDPSAGSVDGHDLLNKNQETDQSRQRPPRTKPRNFEAVAPYRDVPLVTAALLSARFPVVAPAARLGSTPVPEGTRGCDDPPEVLPPATLRDGGYVENSGLLTVIELLPSIQVAIDAWKPADGLSKPEEVPILVVSVDDDPVISGGDPDLGRVPHRTLGISARSGPGYFTRLARDRLESCQYPGVHYVRISPAPHVGAQAATGWAVSTTARREDLVEALANAKPDKRPDEDDARQDDRGDAGAKLQQLRDLLDGTGNIACPAP